MCSAHKYVGTITYMCIHVFVLAVDLRFINITRIKIHIYPASVYYVMYRVSNNVFILVNLDKYKPLVCATFKKVFLHC